MKEQKTEKKCCVDKKMFDMVYDDCLVEKGLKWECDYAASNNINDKSECKYWK